jgi:hypothetical protein
MAEQEGLQVLAFGSQVLHGCFPRTDELADGFMPRVWHPNRREFAGAVQLGQGERIPSVGLDPFARTLRDQRGRDHGTVVAKGDNLPL